MIALLAAPLTVLSLQQGADSAIAQRLAGRVPQQIAALVIDQRFRSDPTHALNESANNLATIHAGVDRATDVDEQIHPRHRQFAGETIN